MAANRFRQSCLNLAGISKQLVALQHFCWLIALGTGALGARRYDFAKDRFVRMNSSKSPDLDPKRGYSRPRLTIYGTFAHFTAGGTGSARESNMGGGQPMRRP
jgi:hypothetical protein